MRLSRTYVAGRIGIGTKLLRQWEQSFPSGADEEHLARWSKALGAEVTWLLDAQTEAPPLHVIEEVRLSEGRQATAADEIAEAALWLALHPSSPARQNAARNARVFARRYGAFGPSGSLQAIGDQEGLTPERVRQICAALLERAPCVRFTAPAISALVAHARPLLPARLEVLEEALRAHLGPQQTLRGLHEFCKEVLDRHIFSIEKGQVGDVEMSIASATGQDTGRAIRVLYEQTIALVRTHGAAQIDFLYGRCAQAGLRLDYPAFRQLALILPDFDWLDEPAGWFWLGPRRPVDNRFMRLARKVEAVAPHHVDVDHLLQVSARTHRHATGTPPSCIELPRAVGLALLERRAPLTGEAPSGGRRTATEVIEAELSGTEALIWQALRTRGGVASLESLKAEVCDAKGVVPMTLQMALRNTPIVRVLDHGLYALVGTSLANPAASASLHVWSEGASTHAPFASGMDTQDSASTLPA